MSDRLRPIDSDADIAEALAGLLSADPRLKAVAEAAGPLPLRRRPGGFEGLASIITSQQISTAAAAVIWARLRATVEPFSAGQFLLTSEAALRASGLSRAKIRTLTAAAGAVTDGLDLAGLESRPPVEAIAAMSAIKGIGPWTAEIYLLFCAGHPDIFPAGDLALQSAVQRTLGLERRPTEKALRTIAAGWAPRRGIAARLFWAYYRAQRTALKESGWQPVV